MTESKSTPAGAVRTDAGGRPLVDKSTGRPKVPGKPATTKDAGPAAPSPAAGPAKDKGDDK